MHFHSFSGGSYASVHLHDYPHFIVCFIIIINLFSRSVFYPC